MLCSGSHPVWVETVTGDFFKGFVTAEAASDLCAVLPRPSADAGGGGSALPRVMPPVEVTFADGTTKTVTPDRLSPADEVFGHADNVNLVYLNAPNLLENVHYRYDESFTIPEKHNHVYTFTGWLLIAVNPYRSLPALYSEERLASYVNKPITAVEPHPFAIAEAAFNAMLKEKASQSIIISGESGAGKTECSKHVLKYLAYASDRRHGSRNVGIEHRVLQTNPILEAFGNAKTIRNDNSSRFGKLMKLHFNANGRMMGASIRTYLLAKSRVCHVPPREKNYHVFYWLCRGALTKERELWSLRLPEAYRYLDCIPNGSPGATQMQELRIAMDSIGISRSTQAQIFRVLTAILTLGNLRLTTGTRAADKASGVTVLRREGDFGKDEKPLQAPASTAVPAMVDELAIVHGLLGLDTREKKDEFEWVITTKKIRETRQNFTPVQAKQTIDALARSLYQFLFDYLVRRINQSLRRTKRTDPLAPSRQQHPPFSSNPQDSGALRISCADVRPAQKLPKHVREQAGAKVSQAGLPSSATPRSADSTPAQKAATPFSRYIGVLDIFGFEDLRPFCPNNFEQLCINYANEKLHNFFLRQLIMKDCALYTMEGLKPPQVHLTDNSRICADIAGARGLPGIFNLLDEASLIPVVGPRHTYFSSKVNALLASRAAVTAGAGTAQQHGGRRARGGEGVSQQQHGVAREQFVIEHFAGDVIYNAEGFCEKNIDVISADIHDFLTECCDSFISRELCRSSSRRELDACARNSLGGGHTHEPRRSAVRHPPLESAVRRTTSVSSRYSHSGSTTASSQQQLLHPEVALSCSGSLLIDASAGLGESAASAESESDEDEEDTSISSIGDDEVEPSDAFISSGLHLRERGNSVHPSFAGVTNAPLLRRQSSSTLSLGSHSYVEAAPPQLTKAQRRRQSELRCKTLASLFSLQVEGLMASLRRTSSFFIRCIKPNDEQLPNRFDRQRVMRQLQTGGMLSVLELMKAGFPCRISYTTLWERFGNKALPPNMLAAMTPKDFTEMVLRYMRTPITAYCIGNTRAFFRFGTLKRLESVEALTDEGERQRFVRETYAFWLKKRVQRAQSAVRIVVRLWIAMKKERQRTVSLHVMHHYRTIYLPRRRSRAACKIQRAWRQYQMQREIFWERRVHGAAIAIQRSWRGFHVRKRMQRLKHTTILLQAMARAILSYAGYEDSIERLEALQGLSRAQICNALYQGKQGRESPTRAIKREPSAASPPTGFSSSLVKRSGGSRVSDSNEYKRGRAIMEGSLSSSASRQSSALKRLPPLFGLPVAANGFEASATSECSGAGGAGDLFVTARPDFCVQSLKGLESDPYYRIERQEEPMQEALAVDGDIRKRRRHMAGPEGEASSSGSEKGEMITPAICRPVVEPSGSPSRSSTLRSAPDRRSAPTVLLVRRRGAAFPPVTELRRTQPSVKGRDVMQEDELMLPASMASDSVSSDSRDYSERARKLRKRRARKRNAASDAGGAHHSPASCPFDWVEQNRALVKRWVKEFIEEFGIKPRSSPARHDSPASSPLHNERKRPPAVTGPTLLRRGAMISGGVTADAPLEVPSSPQVDPSRRRLSTFCWGEEPLAAGEEAVSATKVGVRAEMSSAEREVIGAARSATFQAEDGDKEAALDGQEAPNSPLLLVRSSRARRGARDCTTTSITGEERAPGGVRLAAEKKRLPRLSIFEVGSPVLEPDEYLCSGLSPELHRGRRFATAPRESAAEIIRSDCSSSRRVASSAARSCDVRGLMGAGSRIPRPSISQRSRLETSIPKPRQGLAAAPQGRKQKKEVHRPPLPTPIMRTAPEVIGEHL